MADDKDADKAEAAGEVARDATNQPAAMAGGRANQNEWTASDRRGPLGEAGAERGPEETQGEARPYEPAPGTQSETPAAHPESPEATPAVEPSAPTPDPATEPTHATAPADQVVMETQRQKEAPSRVLPLVAALVVGALIGAGSAALVYKFADQGASQGDVNALATRIDALEKRPDPQAELDRLKASVAQAATQKPEAPAAPAFDPAPLQQKMAGLESDIDALKKQDADADHALGDKVAALEAQAADAKGLAAKVSGLSAALEAQAADAKGLAAKVAEQSGAIDGLKQQDQSTQSGIASLQSGQKTLEGKTGAPALAVAADSLVEAITQGRPYARQVDALASLGADPAKVAVLRENADKGVPSAQALAAQFAPLADPVIATASQTAPNAGFGDRLKSGFFGMVSIRRSDATTGDDVGSRVSRIEADLAHDDVAGAYDTWTGLPAAAKAKSDAWGALAKTQVEAMGAAHALQGQAIAALGGKKS